MRPTTATAPRRVVAGVVSALVAGASFTLFAPVAHADSAPVDATNPATPATVTADAPPPRAAPRRSRPARRGRGGRGGGAGGAAPAATPVGAPPPPPPPRGGGAA